MALFDFTTSGLTSIATTWLGDIDLTSQRRKNGTIYLILSNVAKGLDKCAAFVSRSGQAPGQSLISGLSTQRRTLALAWD